MTADFHALSCIPHCRWQLSDLWTPGISAHEYSTFLWELLDRCTEASPEGHVYFWKPTAAITRIPNASPHKSPQLSGSMNSGSPLRGPTARFARADFAAAVAEQRFQQQCHAAEEGGDWTSFRPDVLEVGSPHVSSPPTSTSPLRRHSLATPSDPIYPSPASRTRPSPTKGSPQQSTQLRRGRSASSAGLRRPPHDGSFTLSPTKRSPQQSAPLRRGRSASSAGLTRPPNDGSFTLKSIERRRVSWAGDSSLLPPQPMQQMCARGCKACARCRVAELVQAANRKTQVQEAMWKREIDRLAPPAWALSEAAASSWANWQEATRLQKGEKGNEKIIAVVQAMRAASRRRSFTKENEDPEEAQQLGGTGFGGANSAPSTPGPWEVFRRASTVAALSADTRRKSKSISPDDITVPGWCLRR